jgi:hypothetical protein
MGEKALVESQLDEALALIRELDATGDSPSLAVWYFYEDAGEWRLLIGGSTFDVLLPKQEALGYRKIAEAMAAAKLASLTISEVKLVETHAALPKALRFLIGTGPKGLVRAHFTNTTLNGIFMKEMIILRSA